MILTIVYSIHMNRADFRFESDLWKKGYSAVAGCDEVGRGCFAGPVVAGCVVFFPDSKKVNLPSGIRIDDSKKLTVKQREKAAFWIKENALAYGVGESSSAIINKLGMTKATRIAFRKAISEANKKLRTKIDFLLADAFFISYVPGLPTLRRKNKKGKYYKKTNGKQLAIIDGDEKSFSIAAASIIAKVYRDGLMSKIGSRNKYKKYDWVKNKGYGTKTHQSAILKYGLTSYHRRIFVDTFLTNHKFLTTKN